MLARLSLLATALVTMACSPDCAGDVPDDHCAPGGVFLSVTLADGSPAPFSGSVTVRGDPECVTCQPRIYRVDCTEARSCGVDCRCGPGGLELDDAWAVSTVTVDLATPDGASATDTPPLSFTQGGGDCCATRLEAEVTVR